MIPVKTIEWNRDAVRLIDQTLLPTELRYLDLTTAEEIWEAIRSLRVRGAPAIGIAAAFGVYLQVRASTASDTAEFLVEVRRAGDYLDTSRPTAINLFWATKRMRQLAERNLTRTISDVQSLLLAEARRMIDEDNQICRALGRHGAELMQDGENWLTHCNAGGLATAQWGTALAPIYIAKTQGKRIHVFADETRPLLQGSRLTAWELQQMQIPVTLITDSMAATVMSQGRVQGVIVGTDRVAANGDVANKIGTLGVAILAKEFGIPFYVAAPLSSIDMSLARGDLIPIEERSATEITQGFGRPTAPANVSVYNPAFDVTPNRYVTGLITERGILRPPYDRELSRVFAADLHLDSLRND